MRRNLRNTAENVRANGQEIKEVKSSNEHIHTRLDAISNQLQILVTERSMDGVQIEDYLPFPDNDTITKFLSNSDGNFAKRKFELDQMLHTAILTNRNVKHFADAICKTLFTRNYIATHKWPAAT